MALAELAEAQTGEPLSRTLEEQEMIFDFRYQRYHADICNDYAQRPGAGVLALYRATAALHADVQMLQNANIALLAASSKTETGQILRRLRHQQEAAHQEGPLPARIPEQLKAFFAGKEGTS